MHTVAEPTLFFSAYLHAAECPSHEDACRGLFQQVDEFVRKNGLKLHATPRPYNRAAEIEFHRFGSHRLSFEVLFQAHTVYPEDRIGSYYECLVYANYDALILQVMITKFQDWKGSLLDGYNELTASICSCFDEKAFAAARDSLLGVSSVYWATHDGYGDLAEHAEEIRMVCRKHELQQCSTDLGAPLWHCDRPIFQESPELSQDFWILVTPRSSETEVNRRFYQLAGDAASEFANVSLARHKISYEKREYDLETGKMDLVGTDLDQCVNRIVNLQRALGPELDELLSQEAIDFQRRLATAGTILADYRQSVSVLKKVRRTFLINQRMFLIHSVALVSERGKHLLANSLDQETAAVKFLGTLDHDDLLAAEISRFQGIRNQANSDIDYAVSEVERYDAALHSAGEQLRIAGERELGEVAHHLAIDSAAVVASIAAVIATEMVLKEKSPGGEVAAWTLTFALVVGSFAVTRMLGTGRGKTLEGWVAAAAALGSLAIYGVDRLVIPHLSLSRFTNMLLLGMSGLVVAVFFGFALRGWITRRHRRHVSHR
jgi:hypothetical protein